eukprot:m.102987 g.102987  ORF g.102987 m.102987 type:complete len:55 (+) comp13791_c0_seq1:3024-3188(+)
MTISVIITIPAPRILPATSQSSSMTPTRSSIKGITMSLALMMIKLVQLSFHSES